MMRFSPAFMISAVSLALLPLVPLALIACGDGGAAGGDRRIPAPGMFVYTSASDLWIQDDAGARLLIAAGQDQQLLQPSISPDGARVAFVVFQLTPAAGATIGADIAVAGLDDPQPQIVFGHEGQAEFAWNPRWTPDGESLIFTQESAQSAASSTSRISVARLRLSTRDVETLRDDARDADISPGGERLVFVAGPYSGDPHLVVRSLADGVETVLDPQRSWQPRPFRIPRFSADGRRVLFSAGQALPQVSSVALRLNGPEDIWSYDLSGGEPRQLAAVGEDQPDFSLSTDGRHALIFGAFGVYLVSTSASEPAYAIAPGEFHGWIDWRGSVSDDEWAAIRASVFETSDAAR